MAPFVLHPDSIFRKALDFAFPPLCLGCGELVTDSGPICEACRRRVQTYSSPICLTCLAPLSGPRCNFCTDGGFLLFAYADYSGPLKDLIVAYKFSGIVTPSDWLARELVLAFKDNIDAQMVDALVPIPLHPGREYFRGYNQALVFANAISDHLELDVNIDILWRTRHRRPQSRSKLPDREKNVHGVFKAEIDATVHSVILVDDVVTTGATVLEARRELQRAGYRVPAVLAIAHGQ